MQVQFFQYKAYHGDYTWLINENELDTHWKSIATCYNIEYGS
jgi:hypothetical protein